MKTKFNRKENNGQILSTFDNDVYCLTIHRDAKNAGAKFDVKSEYKTVDNYPIVVNQLVEDLISSNYDFEYLLAYIKECVKHNMIPLENYNALLARFGLNENEEHVNGR